MCFDIEVIQLLIPEHNGGVKEIFRAPGTALRILVVHNYYRERGGEDAQVEAEVQALRDSGASVRVIAARSGEVRFRDAVGLLLTAGLHSGKFRREISEAVAEWRPDVIHIHNTFPVITPDAIRASVRSGVPTVVTLHNYRVFCANGLCLRQNRSCTKCLNSPIPYGVWHKCYKRSAILSLWVWLVGVHFRAVLRRHKASVVAPSAHAAGVLGTALGPGVLVRVMPNIVIGTSDRAPRTRAGAVYVGRLSSEKGVEDLVQAWKRCAWSHRSVLTIAGTGPLQPSLEGLASTVGDSIRFVGQIASRDRDELLRSAALCVVPSRVAETFGLVVAEAALAGCPLVVTSSGALPETMGGLECGIVVSPRDPAGMAAAIDRVLDDPVSAQLRAKAAQRHAAECYSQSAFYSRLVSLLSDMLAATHEGELA